MFNTKKINLLEIEINKLKNELMTTRSKDLPFYLDEAFRNILIGEEYKSKTVISRLENLEDKFNVLLDYLSLDISESEAVESKLVCTKTKKFVNILKTKK